MNPTFHWPILLSQATISLVRKLIYLSLGSNLGNRSANLLAAIERLSSLGKVVTVSSFYETEPVGFTHQPAFLNCAMALETDKMPKQLLSAILNIEQELGRNRRSAQAKGPRIIDVDILFFGSSIIDSAGLVIPHPAMHQRRFVLEPLAEIAPDLLHPLLRKTIRELRDALPQGQAVRKLRSQA